jgi:AcrR family transcriptional regulator
LGDFLKREKNKEYTRNKLIEVAMELFQKKEYQKTTIEEIAKLAGISKPTFFAYFDSKEQLLYAFDLNQIHTFELYMKEQLSPQGDLLLELREAIVQMAINLHTTHLLTQNMMHLVTINENYKRLLEDTFSIFRKVIKEVVEYGQQHDIIVMEVGAEDVAKDLSTIYLGTLVNWVITSGQGSLGNQMRSTLDHSLQRISMKWRNVNEASH